MTAWIVLPNSGICSIRFRNGSLEMDTSKHTLDALTVACLGMLAKIESSPK